MSRRLRATGALGMAAPLAAAGALEPQGPAARAIADLWWLMLALGAAVFVVFAVVLAVGLRRTGEEPGTGAAERFGRWFVVGGVVVPLIILIVVFGATLAAMRAVPGVAPDDALVIEVTGHRWWYEVHYPEQGVTVTDELHMPVGRPVSLILTSSDVIHSFWVPPLGGKMDMLPDGTNTLVLQADVPGRHLAKCAEFCGLHHANMELTVVAEPADQFSSWVEAQQ